MPEHAPPESVWLQAAVHCFECDFALPPPTTRRFNEGGLLIVSFDRSLMNFAEFSRVLRFAKVVH